MNQTGYPSIDRIVATESGFVRGVAGNTPQYTVFKGIPYAAPPAGDLRWKEPQLPNPWKGVRDASRFSPIAPQRRHGVGTLYGDEFFRCAEPMSEDCLYLNIWTPTVTRDEKFPVLFWIHGGALTGGYGFEPEFDGEAFCREGVVLVTINYRLGVLGFFSHPQLSSESPHGVSGNYGHLDQVAALKWVKRNIENFGGDPDNITIFGQSAGSASVQDLLVSPLTREDIAGAVIMSSASIDKVDGIMPPVPLAQAEELGMEFAKNLGCSSVEELRRLSYEELNKGLGEGFPARYTFGTVLDQYFLEKGASESYFSGDFPDIPLMVGNTMDEASMFGGIPLPVDRWVQHQKEVFGPYAEEYLKLAAVQSPEDIPRVAKNAHRGMVGNRVLCELALQAGHTPPYLYNFDHCLPGNQDGSFHSSELWYVFGTISRCWRPMTGVDYDLSKAMVKYWSNFAKHKNPNGEGLPLWKPYTDQHRVNMVFRDVPCCEPIQETALQAFLKEVMLCI